MISDHFRKAGMASTRAAMFELPSHELLPMFGLVRHRSTKDHEAPSWVRIHIPLLFVVSRPRRRVCASHLVVAAKVVLDKVALLEGVLNRIAVVVARHLDYLIKTNMVVLASCLLVDPIGGQDELTIVVPPAVLLAFYSSIVVPNLVHGSSLSLALMFAED